MKHIYFILSFLITVTGFTQVPSNYYDSAAGLTGYNLKSQLKIIVTNGHSPQSYNDLYTAYQTTHTDNYYENDGTILDFYSEKPAAEEDYNYTHGNNQCGQYDSEGDCYNREHLMPQSVFNEESPMVSDVHHVIPTDGSVNSYRGSLPFGEVNTPDFVSTNGSRRGLSGSLGYSGVVFEPINEFKGDIARALLYFAVRYEDQIDQWNHDMLNGTSNQVFESWFLNVLLDWHYNIDPVNQQEIDRNNAAYNFQGNANPFVNHPEYANLIWNPTPDTQAPTAPTNLGVTNQTPYTISLNWTASTDNIEVTAYDIYVDAVYYTTVSTNTAMVSGLTPETTYSFYVIAKDAVGNESSQSNIVNGTTTEASSTGEDCATENFENIPPNDSQYTNRSWAGNNGQWNAAEARTDQSINNRAILIDFRDPDDTGLLTSPTINGGISSLTVTTQRIYSGDDGTLNVLVNGNVIGTIAYSDIAETFTINNINIEGNVTVEIQDNNSGDARVGIDDLSWTCYSTMSIDDKDLNQLSIYPNPVSGNSISVSTNNSLQFEIYNIIGKLVNKGETKNGTISVQMLNSGVYIIKLSNENQQITKKLIKK